MLIALANPEGDFTATLFAPNDGAVSFASLSDPEAVSLFFKREFPGLVPMVPDLVGQFLANPHGRLATMPYAEAAARAARQAEILDELAAGRASLAEVDMGRAAELVADLPPLPQLDPLAQSDALSV